MKIKQKPLENSLEKVYYTSKKSLEKVRQNNKNSLEKV